MRGAEWADSFVFNPHKWLFTNFDCTAHFVRDPGSLTATLGLKPAYLATVGGKAREPGVTDYNEWSVPLGRRFRALKLWFVIRSYGVEALREKIRLHVALAQDLAAGLAREPDFEVVTQPVLSLFTFRFVPPAAPPDALDDLNSRLLQAINDDGRIYLTQTVHAGLFVIRFQVGQTETTAEDVRVAGQTIREIARSLPMAG
jgi:aromatic-L-amino-acid decarboxylase